MADLENTSPLDTASAAPAKGNQYESPEDAMRRYNIALTNAPADPGILAEIKKFKYDETRLKEGLGMLNKTIELYAVQKKEFGEQLEASETTKALLAKCRAAYNATLEIARTAFATDSNAYTALMLSGKRKTSLSGWSAQALTFYRNLLGSQAFLDKMGYFGFNKERLQAEQKMVSDVIAADAKHKKERGESQEATELRDKSYDDLCEWMSKFYVVAKIALAGKPQWLEKIGIKQ